MQEDLDTIFRCFSSSSLESSAKGNGKAQESFSCRLYHQQQPLTDQEADHVCIMDLILDR